MSDQKLAQMNDRHFVVNVLGKTVVGTEKDQHGNKLPLQFSSFQHFRERYSNRIVREMIGTTKTGKAVFKETPQGTWWLNHPGRRQYDRVGYFPKKSAPTGCYNLWQGFEFTPRPGDWSIMEEHIWRNVCRKDDELTQYVRRWLAFAVQRPADPPGVALVMRGAKGSGKGTVANAVGRLFGRHYLAIANSDHVTGKFNAHLQDVSLFFIDEGFWAGDKKKEGVLKQLITEPFIPIERKFFDVENVPNRLHIIIASNESWVVPARGLERRFLTLDLDDADAQNTKFFGPLNDQLNAGGYEAMLHDLLNEPLADFDVRTAPRTSALVEQMIHSFTPFEEWWFGKLKEGRLLVDKAEWGRCMCKRLFEDYHEATGEKHPLTDSRFGLELRRWVPGGVQKVRPNVATGPRPWMYEFPALDACRLEFERQHGITIDWGEEEGEQ